MVVTLTGPESTGKSTLALALARHYGAELSLEAAREYAAARLRALPPGTAPDALLGPADGAPIARAQSAREDAAEAGAAALGLTLVVRDTDLVSTVVYARHYYGACPAWIVDAARARRAAVYLLCDADLPWVADEQRDRPHARQAIIGEFRGALDELGCPWTLVRGRSGLRERVAIAAVNAFRSRAAADERR